MHRIEQPATPLRAAKVVRDVQPIVVAAARQAVELEIAERIGGRLQDGAATGGKRYGRAVDVDDPAVLQRGHDVAA